MTYDSISVIIVVIVGIFLIGFFSGAQISITDFEHKAVKHGCAQYDTQTGKWAWRNE